MRDAVPYFVECLEEVPGFYPPDASDMHPPSCNGMFQTLPNFPRRVQSSWLKTTALMPIEYLLTASLPLSKPSLAPTPYQVVVVV